MYRIWYSTESFADYIIDHTKLKNVNGLQKNILYESDASKPNNFFRMPDHIRKILYLDACDLIVEKNNEPIFTIEVSTEAGTGHNAFQRFARIVASAENGVPALYIYPEGVIISRQKAPLKWDVINPLVLKAMDSVMSVHNIPAFLFYFPSDVTWYLNNPAQAPHLKSKGLCYDHENIRYSGCPDSNDSKMQKMFTVINAILDLFEENDPKTAKNKMLKGLLFREWRSAMNNEFCEKTKGKEINSMSPLSAVTKIPTICLLNYLSQYEDNSYNIGELLRSREETMVYQISAKFRGDPYPGALAAIDYLQCREGETFEERKYNLVLLFGRMSVDLKKKTISITDENGSSIKDFFKDVKSCSKHNLLLKEYSELKNSEIPRYLMQVRYGSTYSKVKHIRVYSYFSDAILFPDGSLWRDA